MTDYSMQAEHVAYTLNGQDVGLFVHQAPALVKHTGTLAALAGASPQVECPALVTATYLTAAAAIEALLSEAAHDHAPGIYANDDFRAKGAPAKYEWLMRGSIPDELTRIWRVRNALTHSEPDNPRTGEKGEHLTLQGATDAAAYVLDLQASIALKFARP